MAEFTNLNSNLVTVIPATRRSVNYPKSKLVSEFSVSNPLRLIFPAIAGYPNTEGSRIYSQSRSEENINFSLYGYYFSIPSSAFEDYRSDLWVSIVVDPIESEDSKYKGLIELVGIDDIQDDETTYLYTGLELYTEAPPVADNRYSMQLLSKTNSEGVLVVPSVLNSTFIHTNSTLPFFVDQH